MLATLGGYLALLLGFAILLLPLLATELSRPRDSVWGAVVLLLGLVLVTTAERLGGAPMLGVLCGGLLIGRLGLEVGQGRWRLLSEEERQRLWSKERWQTSFNQAGAALAQLLSQASQVSAGLGSWLAERRGGRPPAGKRWVRPEPDQAPGSPGVEPSPGENTNAAAKDRQAATIDASQVRSDGEKDAAVAQAGETSGEVPAAEESAADVPWVAPPEGPSEGEDQVPDAGSRVSEPARSDAGLIDPDQSHGEPSEPPLIEVSSFDEINDLIETAPASSAVSVAPAEQTRSEAG